MAEYLDYAHEYLNLTYTLTCGQAFRWKQDNEGWWAAPVKGKVIRVKEQDNGFLWETLPGKPDLALFNSYFRLDDDVPAIYEHLSNADEHLAVLVKQFAGLRLVRQDPEETIISYVCSTANSVPRISKSVDELSRMYGTFIASAGGVDHYAFPSISALASADPDEMHNKAGLGWRGSNIVTVARQILSHPKDWLLSMRSRSYEDAKADLVALRGIGAKIADCVCLFSLDKDKAVPVDTHIRQVAARFYMPDLKTKTITPAAYDKIVQVFWDKFGDYAGWAQEFLYYEDLLRTSRQQAIPIAR